MRELCWIPVLEAEEIENVLFVRSVGKSECGGYAQAESRNSRMWQTGDVVVVYFYVSLSFLVVVRVFITVYIPQENEC